MRFKTFNVFALISNIAATIACIISVSIMFVYDRLQAFSTLSFYVTILTFVTAFIGMQYNVKRINSNHSLTPTWYMILRLMTITSLIINSLISIAFTQGGAWSISYFLTRLVLPILMILTYIFFDIDKQVPFYATFLSPCFILAYYIVFLPIFSTSDLIPPYPYLDVNNNSWTVTFLLIICVISCSILIALGLKGLNYAIHGKFYKKVSELAILENECIHEEMLDEIKEEEKQVEEEIIKDEPKQFNDEDSLITNHIPINMTSDKIKKVTSETKVNKKVSSSSKTNKKVEEKANEKASKTPTTTTKKVSSGKTSVKEAKNKSKSASTKETSKLNITPTTKTTKKVDTTTKTVKKVEKTSKGKKVEPESKIDTSTRVISRLEINELIASNTKIVKDEDKIYHVSHHKTLNKWQVKLAGGGRALKLFKTQLQAINYAKELVKNKGGSIRIHSVNGQIRKA